MSNQMTWQIKAGQQMGKNEASIEMFKKRSEGAISALVRENVQNSLDVVEDPSQPVRVEFKIDYVNELPGQDELSSIYDKIKNSKPWNGAYNEDIEKIQNILNMDKIPILKVSDFNTTGAAGAADYDEFGAGTSWKAMTEVNGQTLKSQSDSAGSFGIGKNANRAVTPLQLMFFTSQTAKDIHPYSQGWMIYASIVDRNANPQVSGNSFFYKTVDNKPIDHELEEFKNMGARTQPGTDIFIPGIDLTPDFINHIKKALLENFLVSIETNKLTVSIDNQGDEQTISSTNLSEIVAEFGSEDIKSYYNALTQKDSQMIFSMPTFEYKGQTLVEPGDVVFKVFQSDSVKGTRKAMLTRGIGMKINNYPEKGRAFTQGIDFTAVLLVTGRKANELLHNIENPEHTSWNNADKLKSFPAARKLFEGLKSFMRESITSLLPEATEEIVAYGLEELLVDPSLSSGDKVADRLPVHIANIEIKKTVKPISRKRSNGPIGSGTGGEGVPKPKEGGKLVEKKNVKPGLQRNPVSTGDEGDQYIDVTPYMSSVRSKYVNAVHSVEIYPDVSIKNPEMIFEIVGDSSTDTKFNILHAKVSKQGVAVEASENSIKLISDDMPFNVGEPIVVNFETDTDNDVSFNVKVIGKVNNEN